MGPVRQGSKIKLWNGTEITVSGIILVDREDGKTDVIIEFQDGLTKSQLNYKIMKELNKQVAKKSSKPLPKAS